MTSLRFQALVAAASLLALTQAQAADYGLRGSIIEAPAAVAVGATPDWGGFYIGAMGGYTTSNATLNPAYDGLNSAITATGSTAAIMGTKTNANGSNLGFGGFIGYQVPFEDTVIGIEADYLRAGLSNTNSETAAGIDPSKGAPGTGAYTQTTTLSRKIDDLMTLRLRAGWTPGSVMFYATGGLAYARGGYSGAVSSTYDTGGALVANSSASYSGSASAFGLAYGLGIETMLMNRFLLRAEYIGAKFNDFGGAKADVHTFRAGIGFKFGGDSRSYAEAPMMPAPVYSDPLMVKN